jgi:hypothetical protein
MSDPTPSFVGDIKPLFREEDRTAMEFAFDLWAYEDVVAHAAAILAAVEQGSMPCDGSWPEADVGTLRAWIAGGQPA